MTDSGAQTGLGDRVRTRREFLGLNAKELALKAGVHPSHVSLVERGGRIELRPSTVTKLAKALEVSEGWLIHGFNDLGDASPLDGYLPVVRLAASHSIKPDALRGVVEAIIAAGHLAEAGNHTDRWEG